MYADVVKLEITDLVSDDLCSPWIIPILNVEPYGSISCLGKPVKYIAFVVFEIYVYLNFPYLPPLRRIVILSFPEILYLLDQPVVYL